MSEEARTIVEVADGIATVSLNRGDKHNGVDQTMLRALIADADRLRRDRDVRVVILRGKGPSFSSGLDFASAKRERGALLRSFLRSPLRKGNAFQRVCYAWLDLPVPVIASIHGNCFGAGLQIAMGADFRIGHPDSKLSIMEGQLGLIPDMAGTLVFRQHIRMDQLKLLVMTGRVLDADTAQQMGLLTEVNEDPMAAALALAAELRERSPDALAAAKQLLRANWAAGERSALARERIAQARLMGRANQKTAVRRRSGKSDGEYAPRRIS